MGGHQNHLWLTVQVAGPRAESDSAGPEQGLFRSGLSGISTGQSDELLGSGTAVIVERAFIGP